MSIEKVKPNLKRARISHVYGEWLCAEAARHAQPSVPSRPWETLVDRVISALAVE